MRKKVLEWILWLFILIGILLTVSLLSLTIGSAKISLKQILALIQTRAVTIEHNILFDIRLPRIILGLTIGGALSISGVILQGISRNPLVEPYTLGISGGAAVGICVNILLKIYQRFTFISLPFFGFLGAVSVIALVYSLSMRGGILKTHSLLLTGVMISFICSSLVMLIMSISNGEDLHSIIFWIMGSLEEPSWPLIKLTLTGSILGLIISYIFCLDLNALSLGEEEAVHLGVNIERTKQILFVVASLLTGLCVSVAGIIGFVGLVVPHFVRMFIGRDHRILMIGSFLLGGSFLIFCDTLARTIISPMELPVGVATGIFGGAVFIYTLNKRKNY